MEKLKERKEIFTGKVIHVVSDDILIDDNKKANREVVIHNGGACIALKDADGKYFMVKQYRYPQQMEMLEFCAGKIEPGENPDDTILREAREELGCVAKNVKSFGYIIPTCAYSTEKIYLYYGEVESRVKQHFDEDESIETLKYSFSEIKEMIKNKEIADAKTISLMYQIELNNLDK